MVQLLERPEVEEQLHRDTLVREVHERPATPTTPPDLHRPAETMIGTPPARRPIRWMRWLGLVALLVVAAGVAVFTLRDTGSKSTTPTTPPAVTRDYRTADGWERYFASRHEVQRDYRTADGWDRYLTATGMGTLDYRTFDGWERHVGTNQLVMDDYRTADGWERYLAAYEAELISS